MVTQSYAKKIVDLDEAKKERAIAERVELCDALGLPQQKILEPSVDRKFFYPEISGEELYVWRTFLPTIYQRSGRDGSSVRTWSDYHFDLIPNEALREIQAALDSNLFHDLEIWTPERSQRDPVAVGRLGQSVFLIARWGESLAPFEEIRRAVADRLLRGKIQELSISEKAGELLRAIALRLRDDIYFSGRSLFHTHCGVRSLRFEGIFSYSLRIRFCGRCGAECGTWRRLD